MDERPYISPLINFRLLAVSVAVISTLGKLEFIKYKFKRIVMP